MVINNNSNDNSGGGAYETIRDDEHHHDVVNNNNNPPAYGRSNSRGSGSNNSLGGGSPADGPAEEMGQMQQHPAASDHSHSSSSSDHNNNSSDIHEALNYGDGNHDNGERELELTVISSELTQLVMVAAATAATLGYDVGIMAAAIQPLESEMNLSSVQKEVAMGSLNFVAAVGALIGGEIANKKGRKPTVKVCSWLFVVGTICMAVAPNYAILLLGRIITGIGVGVSFVVAPVYLSEVSPPSMRGKVNTVFDVAINGGILLGYVVGFCVQLIPYVADNEKWRIMLGLGLILPIVVLVNLAKLPESPRWLVMADQSTEAGNVLTELGQNPRQVIRTISSIEDELHNESDEIVSLWPTNWSPGMRLVVALGFWQQITGTEAVLYYSADFLAHAGLESATQRLLGNCFVGVCKLAPELIAMQVVDRIGRRPLILGSAVSLVTTTALLSIAFFNEWSPLSVVILLCAVMASFSVGLGPFTFLVASESLGLSERATGMTLCAASNRCTSGTVALTAVSLYESLGSAGLFALYAGVGLVSLPFYYKYAPETTGQTLEQLAEGRRTTATNIPKHRHNVEHPPDTAAAVELNGEMT